MNAVAGLLVAITALVILAVLLFVVKPKSRAVGLSPLAALSFACILAGVVVSDEPWLGYILMASGVGLAVADIIDKYRKGHPQ